ncbi:MAG TPA: prolyl oligopeptidase family serine peptidase [Gaiellaceae bacterium]|nr:prolyl oligopeptidase family serine peptidase [Gaiellaceae bacterium]
MRELLHGVEVADPYRWLEETDAPDVRRWTDEQNAATRATLDAVPFRDRIRARLDKLLQVGLLEVPVVAAGAAFYLRRDPDQDQSVLYVREAGSTDDRPLVNTNAEDALVTIDWFHPSQDGRLVAYGLSRGGDELSTLHVVEVATGRVLDDRIPDTRFSSVAWLPDSSGFYYTRLPAKGSVPPGEERYNSRVRFHRLGDDPADDPVVFGEGREPTDLYELSLSRDGRFLLIHVNQGWSRTILFVRERDGELRSTGEEREAIFSGRVADGRLYVLTNWEAPNWRVLELDPATLDLAGARTVVAERDDAIVAEIALVGGRLVAHELEDASSRVRVYELPGGALERELELPDLGSVQGTPSRRTPGLAGEWDADELLFGFTSFLHPPAVLRCDLATGAVTTFAELEAPPGFDPDAYETRRVLCRSADGTSVPMFLVHRRGLEPDGSAPVFLYGYGGFNIGMTPYWVSELPLWVEAGGVYAVAVLRGGNEFGERWHRDGMLDRKQNVFDDFVAAADRLVAEGYTSRERLAICGRSNGGLLVGAVLTQRPDLCRAVVCEVPLLDMLRYHGFQVAKLWIPEYGSPEDPEQFRWLHAYSPYDRVVDGERYPAVLLTTALGDTRVDPMHARKMAARLQAATSSDLPVLLRVDEDAGHGIGKPRSMQLDAATDVWSFVFWQLGVKP